MIGREPSIPEFLRRRSASTPDRVAFVFADKELTFRDLEQRAEGAAGLLYQHGVLPGDRVALLAANSLAFAAAIYGIGRAGAVLVPVNIRLTPAEIEAQLLDCEPRAVVGDESLFGSLPSAAAFTKVPIEALWSADGGAAPMQDAIRGSVSPLHSLIYTSGTTGRAKGAMLSQENFVANATLSASHLGLREDDAWLACMPLFHVGGLSIVLRTAINGITVEIQDGFDAGRVIDALLSGRVSFVSLVPTMLQRMLDLHDGGFHSNLRCVLLGGGPIPPALVDECVYRGIPVSPTYGLTEAASQVATLLPSEALIRGGAAGRVLKGIELRIERDGGTQCYAGEPGEIVLRGPTITAGYYRRPDATALALHEGWFHTGDFGYVDEGDYLHILDRRDDLIVSGGENVYPAEVEAVLASYAGVREAGVFGIKDENWGQSVAAAVAIGSLDITTTEELRAFARERLASYKVPRVFFRLPQLPRNASGKLLRRELRRLAEEGQLEALGQ